MILDRELGNIMDKLRDLAGAKAIISISNWIKEHSESPIHSIMFVAFLQSDEPDNVEVIVSATEEDTELMYAYLLAEHLPRNK